MKICKDYDDMEAVDLLAGVSAGKRGGDNNPYGRNGKPDELINDNNINIDLSRPVGTSTAYTMRRLAKDYPAIWKSIRRSEHRSLQKRATSDAPVALYLARATGRIYAGMQKRLAEHDRR